MTDGLGHTTQYQYDARKRLTVTTYHDQTTTTNAYDGPGNLAGNTDQAGNQVQYTYDGANQLKTVVQLNSPNTGNNTNTYGYDNDGKLSTLSDENDHTTQNAFDLAYEMTSKVLPDGSSTERHGYDDNGNLNSLTHFSGTTTSYTYDPLNRLLSKVPLASPALQQVINDLQALRGIADISAVTIAAELGQVSRFGSARQLMGYCGAVPSEDSSGKRTRRGGITRTGNAHLRRVAVEAAWSYRRPPGIWYGLRRRQESISEKTKEIAWKAQHRLHRRYMKLGAAGKDQRKVVTAVARELRGFIWAIGTRAETVATQQAAA